MKKYWHVINIGIQNNLTYRFNFLARAVFGLIPLIAMLYVWRKIYSGKAAGTTVGTYSLAQMISYYLLTTVVDALTAVNEDDWQIAADIKDGNISQFLLKPIDYLWYRLCLFLSGPGDVIWPWRRHRWRSSFSISTGISCCRRIGRRSAAFSSRRS